MHRFGHVIAAGAVGIALALPAAADERLLREAIDIPTATLFMGRAIPAVVLGVTLDGETAVVGFGAFDLLADLAPR
jgi:hypothetical protein